jgi:AmmeMemoRadiSam system protein B
MPTLPERPQLRRGLAAQAVGGGAVVLFDQRRASRRMLRISRLELDWAQLFDGERTLAQVQAVATRQAGGLLVPLDRIGKLAERLDEALLLDSPRFAEYLDAPVREPSCIGVYDADPDVLHTQLEALFTAGGGPGRPAGPRGDGPPLRAVLLPHMDYGRGGVCYGWGFKELAERSTADLFVIVGTSHYSPARFSLTRKHFATPLGVVETDQNYVDRLVSHYGGGLFDDPLAHLPEHSIELEVVPLQHLRAGGRPFRIVPLLVGSFHDCVAGRTSPAARGDIARMVAALRAAEAAAGESVCYVISGDLAHIGPKFDEADPPAAGDVLTRSRRGDEAILTRVEAADPAAYFETIAAEDDARRICGLPPTWLVLEAARPSRGRVLNYTQFAHPEGYESVSFASAAFDA